MEANNEYHPDIDLVERFLDGELTAEETAAFGKRIASDPGFLQLLNDRKEIQETYVRARIKETVQEEVRRIAKEDLQRQRFIGHFAARMEQMNRRYAIAAAIILLAGVALAALFLSPGLRDPVMAFFGKKTSVPVQSGIRQEYKARHSIFDDAGTVVVFSGDKGGTVVSAGKNIFFRWSGETDSLLNFTITDAGRGMPVFVAKLNAGDTSFLLMRGILKPGRYTWHTGEERPAGYFTVE